MNPVTDVAATAAAAQVPSGVASAAQAAPATVASAPLAAAPSAVPHALGAGTGAADPLAQLRGIHLPDPVGIWPPAPGWWMLAALLIIVAIAGVLWTRARRHSVARHALRELDTLATRSGTDLQDLATAISALLRRVALLRFGRARVAPLHGRAWQDFLGETAPRSRRGTAFPADAGELLALAPYAPAGAACLTADGTSLDGRSLIAAARAWIKENA